MALQKLTAKDARKRVEVKIMREEHYERSEFRTLYLGIYNNQHAFQVQYYWPDSYFVDVRIPIIYLVSASQTLFLQGPESLEIYRNLKTGQNT